MHDTSRSTWRTKSGTEMLNYAKLSVWNTYKQFDVYVFSQNPWNIYKKKKQIIKYVYLQVCGAVTKWFKPRLSASINTLVVDELAYSKVTTLDDANRERDEGICSEFHTVLLDRSSPRRQDDPV